MGTTAVAGFLDEPLVATDLFIRSTSLMEAANSLYPILPDIHNQSTQLYVTKL